MTSTAALNPRPWWRSRRGRIALVVAFLMVVSVAAWAAVQSNVRAQGKVGRGQYVATWDSAQTQMLDVTADGVQIGEPRATPSQPLISADKRTATLPSGLEAFHGEAVRLSGVVRLAPGVTRKGYVSGIYVTGAMPAGWQVSFLDGCGGLVDPTSASATVRLLLRPTSDVGPDLDLTALGGLQVVTTALPPSSSTPPTGVVCAPLGS